LVCEDFSNSYPDREIPDKTTLQPLVTKLRDKGSVYDRQNVLKRAVLAVDTHRNVEETLLRQTWKYLRSFNMLS
jgi:hypothetical protein